MTNEPTAELPAQRAGIAAPGRDDRAVPTAAASPTAASPGAASPGAAAPTTASVTLGPSTAATVSASPRGRRRWPVVVLSLLLLAALGAAGYLYATTTAYADRLAWTEDQARQIGTELVTTRGELDGVRGELEGVRTQLATAQERITALADEKAQIGDDREAQAQLLDYQARVSEAAGTVASALDRCVQGQDQLIEYLGDPESYDPAELARFGQDVERLCRSASDANIALQAELVDR